MKAKGELLWIFFICVDLSYLLVYYHLPIKGDRSRNKIFTSNSSKDPAWKGYLNGRKYRWSPIKTSEGYQIKTFTEKTEATKFFVPLVLLP